MQPFCAPRSRSRRVSAACRCRRCRRYRSPRDTRRGRPPTRKFDATRGRSRITRPAANGAPRFDVLGVDADVADVRIREGDDLARVRRVGQDLLVAGHRRVEDDLADRVPRRADRAPAEDAAVGERQQRGRRRPETAARVRVRRRSRRAWRRCMRRGRSARAGGLRGSGRAKRERRVTRSRSRFEAANYTGERPPLQRAWNAMVAQR